jgi:hypothetical protein
MEMVSISTGPCFLQREAIRREFPGLADTLKGFQLSDDGGGTVGRRAGKPCLQGQIGDAQSAIGSGRSSLDKAGKCCAQGDL